MKKVFEAPLLEIVYFDSKEDIVTASCTGWENPEDEFDFKENF